MPVSLGDRTSSGKLTALAGYVLRKGAGAHNGGGAEHHGAAGSSLRAWGTSRPLLATGEQNQRTQRPRTDLACSRRSLGREHRRPPSVTMGADKVRN